MADKHCSQDHLPKHDGGTAATELPARRIDEKRLNFAAELETVLVPAVSSDPDRAHPY